MKILYILRNDLDVLPLPDQPFKRFSSHYSNGRSNQHNILDNTVDEFEGIIKQAIDISDIESKRNSIDRSKFNTHF